MPLDMFLANYNPKRIMRVPELRSS